jgi:WD40 repeat protein
MLLQYANGKLRTRELRGVFRSFAWDMQGTGLILVGDRGRILKVEGERSVIIPSGMSQNLRGISVSPLDGSILAVGNAASAILLDERMNLGKVLVPGSENLRAVSWNPEGNLALIAGNRGSLLVYKDGTTQIVEGGRANLRHVGWRPKTSLALVTSNCFADEFIPSPNLFSYEAETQELISLNEGRADLIGVDWKPDGSSAIVVGYDVIWHNGVISTFDGQNLSPIEFPNKRVYPVAVSWNPKKPVAAIVTAVAQPGMGEGIVYLWDEKALRPIFRNNAFFFSAVAWNKEGTELVALGSSATRAFNC